MPANSRWDLIRGLKGYTPVVYFLLGNSPASEFYMPTFRNTLTHLHRRVSMKISCEDGSAGCSETLAYKIQMPGNYPEEKHTTLRTRRKFEIKNIILLLQLYRNVPSGATGVQ